MALEKTSTFFFTGAKNLSASVVTIASSVKCHSARKHRLPVEITHLDIKRSPVHQEGPIVTRHPKHFRSFLSV